MEVDLVSLDQHSQRVSFAVEIKWSNRSPLNPRQELVGLLDFCKKNLEAGQVSTRSVEKTSDVDGIGIYYAPISVDCWSVGRFFVQGKLEKGSHPLAGTLLKEP